MAMTLHFLRLPLQQLEAYLENSELLAERVRDNAADPCRYDIDKSWDGIAWLLTGSTSSDTTQPLTRLFFSGRLVDQQQDLGTGPAHYLLPGEVRDLNGQIAAIEPESLKERFDAAAMKEAGVYPANVWAEAGTDDYLAEYFETVQEAFAAAAAAGEAVITFVQ